MEAELTSPLLAEIELAIYKKLQKKMEFDPWHALSTIYSRGYAKWIVYSVNELLQQDKEDGYIVEIGCGLGEIVGNIKWKKRVGYDKEETVIKAARLLRTGTYRVGSFEDIRGIKIKVLILTNFIHGISPEQLRLFIDCIRKNNIVEYIVLDTVKGKGYLYFHEGSQLWGGDYILVKRSERFNAADNAARYEEIWKRIVDEIV